MQKLSDKEKEELIKRFNLLQMPTAQDKHQTILFKNGILPNPNAFAVEIFRDKVKNKMLICPFCLSTKYYSEFTHEKGYYKCSICKQRMTEHTMELMFEIFNTEKNIKTEKFAQWVFGYRLAGFFDKLCLNIPAKTKDSRFNEWNNRLKDLDISYDFWDFYKKFKGEYKAQKQENEE